MANGINLVAPCAGIALCADTAYEKTAVNRSASKKFTSVGPSCQGKGPNLLQIIPLNRIAYEARFAIEALHGVVWALVGTQGKWLTHWT